MARRGRPALILSGTVLAAMAGTLATPLGANLWFLATEPAYVIPESSSLLSFRPTEMNPGSGDWWLYGEDASFYYHYSGTGAPPYLAIEKGRADSLPGFDPLDAPTWPDPNGE